MYGISIDRCQPLGEVRLKSIIHTKTGTSLNLKLQFFLFEGTWHVKGDSIHESNYICRRGPAMGVHGWKRGTGESVRKRMLS